MSATDTDRLANADTIADMYIYIYRQTDTLRKTDICEYLADD